MPHPRSRLSRDHWLYKIGMAFGHDAKISLSVDTFRHFTISIDVERQNIKWSISKVVTWDTLEHATSDPLARLADELISDWRLMQP